MRLVRLRFADFYQGRELRLELGRWQHADPSLTFLVGPNGTGKSRVLESVGRLFSHLSAGVPAGLDFDLEYELEKCRVLVTTRPPELADGIATEADRLDRLDAWLLVAEGDFTRWKPEHVRREWPSDTELDGILPFRVLGLSTGPASRLDWALRGAVTDTLGQRLISSRQPPPADVPAEEWEAYDASERESLSRELRVAQSESRCIALSGEELSLAVLALLGHPGMTAAEEDDANELLGRVGLSVRGSLLAFAFEVSGDWRNCLPQQEHRPFEALLLQAARRVALERQEDLEETDLDERDQRVVFQIDADLHGWLAGVADSPFVWFSQLLGWLKAGAIRSVRLILKKDGTDELLLDSDFSDGEFLLAGRYGLLLLLREKRDCLVLFDEPETHFNDQWKVSLVSDLVRILEGGAAQVLIATHSDITLSDADQSTVHLLHRAGEDGEGLEVTRPPVSPFAADRNSITTSVFGAASGSGRFAAETVDRALQSEDPEEIRALLDRVGPGFHQFRLQFALYEDEGDAG